MDQNKKLLIGAGVALAGLIGYAIYTDLARLFPKKDSEKNKNKFLSSQRLTYNNIDHELI